MYYDCSMFGVPNVVNAGVMVCMHRHTTHGQYIRRDHAQACMLVCCHHGILVCVILLHQRTRAGHTNSI